MLLIFSVENGNVDHEPPFINGDSITISGNTYDFGPLTEGAEIDVGEPFIGNVRRTNGIIVCKFKYLYSSETAQAIQSTNWEDYTFEIESGQCPCPIKRKPLPAEPVEVENEQ